MTASEINAAIAEACGSKILDLEIHPQIAYQWGSIKGERYIIPNYHGDLNAMHEAEKILDGDQFHAYTLQLSKIGWELFPSDSDAAYKERLRVFCGPTAQQRAEAFLKTIGKWSENKKEQG